MPKGIRSQSSPGASKRPAFTFYSAKISARHTDDALLARAADLTPEARKRFARLLLESLPAPVRKGGRPPDFLAKETARHVQAIVAAAVHQASGDKARVADAILAALERAWTVPDGPLAGLSVSGVPRLDTGMRRRVRLRNGQIAIDTGPGMTDPEARQAVETAVRECWTGTRPPVGAITLAILRLMGKPIGERTRSGYLNRQ
jgi:hypothetical protein